MEKGNIAVPLVCHGHSHPVVNLFYSPATPNGFFPYQCQQICLETEKLETGLEPLKGIRVQFGVTCRNTTLFEGVVMEGELKHNEGFAYNFLILLEFSACDDVDGFRHDVEEEGFDVDEVSLWYGSGVGLRKMDLEERSPLMIFALSGSREIVKYIVSVRCVDVNRACGFDGATALHCAADGGSGYVVDIVQMLMDAYADAGAVDAKGKRLGDVISLTRQSSYLNRKILEGFACNFSILLEFSACDDVDGFRHAVEEEGFDVDEVSLWYGRGVGSRKMGIEERTPLMISALFGSRQIVKYIISIGRVYVNMACGSDGATALHCAAAGVSGYAVDIVKILIDAYADVGAVDAKGKRPGDVITLTRQSSYSNRKILEMLLNGVSSDGEG